MVEEKEKPAKKKRGLPGRQKTVGPGGNREKM